jgi:hypothetical protein
MSVPITLQEPNSAQCASRCSNSTRTTAKPLDQPNIPPARHCHRSGIHAACTIGTGYDLPLATSTQLC